MSPEESRDFRAKDVFPYQKSARKSLAPFQKLLESKQDIDD